jgi:exosortase D (VPLPA-CTERM-specific)
MTSTTEFPYHDQSLSARARPNWQGFGWFLFCCLGALPLFWPGFMRLGEAWARPEYSHGPVIPVLSFYMFLRELKAVPPVAPGTDRGFGLIVTACALCVAVVGLLVDIPDIVTYALILWIGGLVLVGFGFARGIVFWTSVLHLVFMLPLPNMVYWNVSITLQFFSSEIGVFLVRLFGVPVFLDGNIIDLGVYKLQVAEACSGLRYLFPIMSFTYVFAVLYRGPRWHKLVLLFSAVPLAVLMNAGRIGIIGVLVDRYGIAQAEGFLHVFEGWVVFLSCIAVLFLMAMAMQRLSGDRRPLGEALEMDFTGLGAQFARVFTIAPSAALVAMALLTAGVSAAWWLAPARATVQPERETFDHFPMRGSAGSTNTSIADETWTGRIKPLDPGIADVLGADDHIAADFHRSTGDGAGDVAAVDFFAAYYQEERAGGHIHSPAVCLPSSGWEVFRIEPVDIALPGTAAGQIRVNRAIIQKGLQKQLVYFWFEGRGRSLASDIATKFYTVADSLVRGRRDIGIVRLITPVGDAETAAVADDRLKAFLAANIDHLPRFFPK